MEIDRVTAYFLVSFVTLYLLTQRLIEEENMLAPSLKQFSLRVEILPSYIPVRVAEKILFVGESVQMFENQNVNLTRKGRKSCLNISSPRAGQEQLLLPIAS